MSVTINPLLFILGREPDALPTVPIMPALGSSLSGGTHTKGPTGDSKTFSKPMKGMRRERRGHLGFRRRATPAHHYPVAEWLAHPQAREGGIEAGRAYTAITMVIASV